MNKIKITYFNIIFAFVLSISSCKTHAQTKSTDVRTVNGKKYYIHKVEKGQSLYAIAKVYNLDVNSILAENDDAIDGINQGQELKIPFESLLNKPTTTAIDTNKYVYHKVLKGETIYAITKKYNTDEKKLQALNPTLVNGLKEGEFIAVGEKKSIKAISTVTATTIGNSNDVMLYTVQQGETLYGLSKKFNVTTDDIIKWNHEAKDGIKQGQVIKLKVNSKQPTTVVNTNTLNATNTVTNTTTNPIVIDTTKFNKPKKNLYEIGLFLPFKLNETELINLDELLKNKSSFPASQSLALDFYLGFKKAVDSIRSQDFDINIHLFDTEDKDSAKIETICKTAEFKALDAIFGPMHLSNFKIVAKCAKQNQIPIVSPVIQQNKILYQNSLISKASPSLFTMIEGLADYCSDSLMSNSHIVIANTRVKDQSYVKAFKNRYNANLIKHGKTLKDSVLEVKGLAGIKTAYVPGKKNIVIMLTNDPVYLQDNITQLTMFADKKDIVLMGFNSVSNIDNIDQEYLNKLQFHFASTNHIDYSDSTIINFTKEYQSINFTDPSEYYFEGFDIAHYYLSHVKTYGTGFFLNLDKAVWDGISTGFKFFRPDKETGFENRFISIYRYSNYKLQRIGWK